ncbi:MAG TPA: hypothetical protein VGB26_10180 [Nitrospiria bacterium]|jgi:hypothetical protein
MAHPIKNFHQTLGIIVLGVFFFTMGCNPKEEKQKGVAEAPSPPSQTPSLPSDHPPLTQGMEPMVPPLQGNSPTVVPKEVQGKWKAVRLMVDDKVKNKSKEFVVNLNKRLVVPDSKLTVQVGDFLPDLKIQESTFTSASNDLSNPAVHVNIFEDGKPIFDGWLFSMFPTIHPFQHDQYRILLKGAIPTETDTRP